MDGSARDVTLFGMLAVIAGFVVHPYLQPGDIQTSRPTARAALSQHALTRLERIEAPLWEDPFTAVRRQIDQDKEAVAVADAADSEGGISKRKAPRRGSVTSLDDLKSSFCDKNALEPMLVLVPLDPGNHPSVVEARRRTRVALQEAMSQEGASALDGHHLGVFRQAVQGSSVLVPFERFEHHNAKGQTLVLWIDQEIFMERPESGADPWRNLHYLATAFSRKCGPKPLKVAIVGPAESGELFNLLGGRGPKSPQRWASLHSPGSTVAPAALLSESRADASPEDAERRLVIALGKRGLEFRRHIRPDTDLQVLLKDEIERRHQALSQANGRTKCNIILITEGDSLYGRELAKGFDASACTVFKQPYQFLKDINDPIAKEVAPEMPGPERRSRATGKTMNPDYSELAEGAHQFDYIRRLALRIRRDVESQPADFREGLLAIGMFGNEASDKVSLMRALRPYFGTATYFTTDLDAGLWNAVDIPFTRNLVVASAYDLIESPLQQGSPFRNAYQTSHFRAFRAVIREEWLGIARQCGDLPPPKVFEIGLTGPIELAPELGSWQRVVDGMRRHGLMSAVGLLLVLGVIGRAFASTWRFVDTGVLGKPADQLGGAQKTGLFIRVVLVALAGLALIHVVTLFVSAWRETSTGVGEPLVLFEGVSLWGPTILRTVSLVLGFWFLVSFFGRTREVERRIGETYGLRGRGADDAVHEANPGGWKAHAFGYLHSKAWQVLYFLAPDAARKLDRRGDSEPDVSLVDAFLRAAGLGRKARDAELSAFEQMLQSPRGGMPDVPDATIGARVYRRLWAWYQRRSCLLPLDSAILAGALVVLIAGVFDLVPDPNLPARGAHIAELNMFLLKIAGGIMFAMAIAAALHLGQVRSLVHVMGVAKFWRFLGAANGGGDAQAAEAEIVRNVFGTSEIWQVMAASVQKQRYEKAVNRSVQLMLVRDLTEAGSWFIYAPFVLLTFLIVARWPQLENHDFPLVLVLLFLAVVVFVVANAQSLHLSAMQARERALMSIREALAYSASARSGLPDGAPPRGGMAGAAATGQAPPSGRRTMRWATRDRSDPGAGRARPAAIESPASVDANAEVYWLNVLQDRVEHIREGAFRPIWEQPVLKAALIPLGGAGLTQVADILQLFATK